MPFSLLHFHTVTSPHPAESMPGSITNPFKRTPSSSQIYITDNEMASPSKNALSSLVRRLSSRSKSNAEGNSTSTYSTAGQAFLSPSFASSGGQRTSAMGPPGDMPFDQPPSYTEATKAVTSRLHVKDDAFAFLSQFDTVFLIDDSGSMQGQSWAQTAKALEQIAPVCAEHDEDGVDVVFMNMKPSPRHLGLKTAAEIRELFETTRPNGRTPTAATLRRITKPYLEKCAKLTPDKVKPLNIIVITDGAAHDDVESEVIKIANKLEKMDAASHQIGIQFFQVGNDQAATQALAELDDGLVDSGCPRDIVDTVPFKGELRPDEILKVVLGAVHRRLDRKRLSGESTRPGRA